MTHLKFVAKYVQKNDICVYLRLVIVHCQNIFKNNATESQQGDDSWFPLSSCLLKILPCHCYYKNRLRSRWRGLVSWTVTKYVQIVQRRWIKYVVDSDVFLMKSFFTDAHICRFDSQCFHLHSVCWNSVSLLEWFSFFE